MTPAAGRAPIVVKFGGELLEETASLQTVARAIANVAGQRGAVTIVHGGGKAIDAALATAGIPKRQVEGLRITDDRTLDVVVSVVAGLVNSRFVAALNAAGVGAVGLTGADARCGLADPAPAHVTVDGARVDLGRVGIPSDAADPHLVATLMDAGFVPVVACIGLTAGGQLLNVNADTFAAGLSARLGAGRLVIAGTTPGVLDDGGRTLPTIDGDAVQQLIASRTATAGMIAKLRACEDALAGGAHEVVIVDGRDRAALEAAARGESPASATRVIATARAAR